MPLWFWADTPLTPVSVDLTLGPEWVNITATPTGLRWVTSTGDTTPCPITTNGSFGKPWTRGADEHDPTACWVLYNKASDHETAHLVVDWQVTWDSSQGPGEEPTPRTFATPLTTKIYERHAINTTNP